MIKLLEECTTTPLSAIYDTQGCKIGIVTKTNQNHYVQRRREREREKKEEKEKERLDKLKKMTNSMLKVSFLREIMWN